jgi:ABC-type spermidine/putrescine transport system permease subunit I
MSESRFASVFLVPGALWLLLLFVVPVGFVLALSFGYTDDLGEAFYGTRLDNYERVSTPPSCRCSFARSASRSRPWCSAS